MKRSTAASLTIVYTALMCAWFALWYLTGDDLWWMSLVNHVVPYLFVPALLFTLWAALRRHVVGISLIVPAFIFGSLYWPYLIPQPARTGAPALRVMTYNILFSNDDMDGVARVILSQGADLVALQEVQPTQMVVLRERLSGSYPHSVIAEAREFGATAVFSRHPFSESRIVDTRADRKAVLVRVYVDGRPIQFVSAHLLAFGLQWIPLREFPEQVERLTNEQIRQARIVRDEAVAFDGVSILACDCNARETSQSYREIHVGLAEAAREIGWATMPTPAGTHLATDLQRLDHIFYRGAIRPIAAYAVGDQGGSDHAAVVAVFARR